jgi:putative phosphoesterase
LLQSQGAEFLIHCGDVGSQRVLDLLAGLPVAFVWGNNDWDRQPMEAYAALLGLRCLGEFGELELGGKTFAVVHGDDARALRRVLADQRHDYLLHGHTHVRRDERVGRVRIVNPGALHRAKEKTVALLDTETDELSFLSIPGV